MTKLKFILKWVALGIVIWSMIVVLIYLLCPCAANAADHAIVSFDGYELYADTVSFDNRIDLIAKTKAVVGVRDTTWWELWFTQTKADSAIISVQLGDSLLADSVRFYPHNITCRRLVGVTVTREQGIREIKCYDKWGQYSHTGATMKPRQAIVWFEKLKCIK